MSGTRVLARTGDPASPDGYEVTLAADETGVHAAQRLRHAVFTEEFGDGAVTAVDGRDVDAFDALCDHLVVHATATGELVGTYRLLPPRAARAARKLYADGEFDLSALAPLRDDLVEAGRACVHPRHRNGTVMLALWSGILTYLTRHQLRWLCGCASVPLDDGGSSAALAWRTTRERHYAPLPHRVSPLVPWQADAEPEEPGGALPPLLQGYLRLGAWVCGPPAYDAAFDAADLFVLLSLDRVHPGYLRLLGRMSG
ncbi:GNAT family N-acetyltransferase [Streptomyces roseoverticillatus]|uniref:GNAT family N-acetyltransferase n=1 Tax=Streptomyces roseoverticillatus TaxID=66429 RepID=UPI001F4155E4|nr:GNAT family N-acetyltransferase [Streptomyces roseoverticillatus]MCF3106981.1 GNAT family N-acetyltransferase [Streptomyces roseoverticillatus]